MFKHSLFALLLVLLNGCQLLEPTSEPERPVSTDIQKLAKLINLPNKPVKVMWQTKQIGMPSMAPGPDDYALVAVITFEKQTVENLIKKTPNNQKINEVKIRKKFVSNWFPQALKDSLKPSDTADYVEINQTAYEAHAFSKSSFSDGYFFRIGKTSDVFLYLQTH